MIIDNMFQEHTARRCLQGSAQKIKRVAPTYLAPMASKVNTTALKGRTPERTNKAMCLVSFLFLFISHTPVWDLNPAMGVGAS